MVKLIITLNVVYLLFSCGNIGEPESYGVDDPRYTQDFFYEYGLSPLTKDEMNSVMLLFIKSRQGLQEKTLIESFKSKKLTGRDLAKVIIIGGENVAQTYHIFKKALLKAPAHFQGYIFVYVGSPEWKEELGKLVTEKKAEIRFVDIYKPQKISPK